MSARDSVIIELEPVKDSLQSDDKEIGDSINSEQHRDGENQPLLKTKVTTEVVESSDTNDNVKEKVIQELGTPSEIKNDPQEDEENNERRDSAIKKTTSNGNEVHTASTEEDAGCGVEVKNGSQVDDKNMTLPWIICEAIWDGDVAKVRRWLNSLPKSLQEKAYLFRLSPKFQGLDSEIAFRHAVFECDNPEIPSLFLSAAGEKLLDSDVVHAIKRGSLNAVISWIYYKDGKCDEYKHWDGSTALHLAAEFNEVEIAEKLIRDGADPNARRLSDGASVMHVAFSNEYLLDILLDEENLTIDALDNKAFLHMIKSGNLSISKKMMDKQPLLVNSRGSSGVTALHLTSERGDSLITELVLEYGADIDPKADDGVTPLHLASKNGHTEIAGLLAVKGANVHATNRQMWTPLHFACKEGHREVAELMIGYGANVNAKHIQHWTPLHLASKEGHVDIAKMLIDKGADVKITSRDGLTPLHLACKNGHFATAKTLIEQNTLINTKDRDGRTPLHYACIDGHFDTAKLLLQHRALTNVRDYGGHTPMYIACQNGHDEIVQLLLDNEVEIKPEMLRTVLEQHHERIVKIIINKAQNWPELMRQKWPTEDEVETTPFREMIKLAPDTAEDVLNMCTVKTTSRAYAIAFNYEFVEDFAIIGDATDSDVDSRPSETKKYNGYSYEEVKSYATSDFCTSWGPVKFTKDNHPLAIMVQYERLNLLQHPLISCLLHRKWRKFGQYFYFGNLLAYSVYLLLLTAFALIVPNPRSHMCFNVNSTENSNCDTLSSSRRGGIYFTGIIVIILALCRLVVEVYQMVSQRLRYFQDWVNWIEWFLLICSVIFVSVFRNECLCVRAWQWQIGILAVFLGWIELIFFLSKLPLVGLYVVMFLEILKTVLKLILFSCLLLIAFGLAFYMAFFEPDIVRSPFSSVPRSLLKTMTMSTGEFDFDTIFRQDPAGERAGAEEIPFPAVSYILWIVFVILMPVLLTNMLIGLAVGDIGAIQQVAELKKLSLQVEQVLTIEDLLPDRIQRKLRSGYKEISPNKKEILFQDLLQFLFCCICCACLSRWWYVTKQNKNYEKHKRRMSRHAQFIMWGGSRYDTLGSINKVVKPPEDAISKTDKLLRSVKELKVSNSKEKEKSDQLYDRQGKLIDDVVEMKADKEKMDKLILDQNKCLEDTGSKADRILQEIELMKETVEKQRANFVEQVNVIKETNAVEREAFLNEIQAMKETLLGIQRSLAANLSKTDY